MSCPNREKQNDNESDHFISTTNKMYSQTKISFFGHSLRIDIGFVEHKGKRKHRGKTLFWLSILPRLPFLFSSWHGDMHDKSCEANCKLCLYRKHKGISGVVHQWQLCCRQSPEQWPQTPLALGKLSQAANPLKPTDEIKLRGKWEKVI